MDDKEKKIRSEKRKIAHEEHLDYLLEMYDLGMPLDQEELDDLEKTGRIEGNTVVTDKSKKTKKGVPNLTNKNTKTDAERSLEEALLVLNEDIDGDFVVMDESQEEAFLKKHKADFIGRSIKTEEWKVESVIEHEEDFYKWVNSINSGFQNMIYYDKFEKYKQQSRYWQSEKKSVTDFEFKEDQKNFMVQEYERCRDSSMYFLNTYVYIKEGDMTSGSRRYDTKPVHEIIAFLIDSGYSIIMGKPRQIAATTTLGAIALKELVFNRNFFLKFITMDKETGVEIFEDKMKYPFSELPSWMRPKVANDRDNLFVLADKSEKGIRRGNNSKLQVVAPSRSAINGGAPQKVFIDEAGYIGILSAMIKEGRPTMFWQNPETKKIELKRQVVIWGTGGDMDAKGGAAYQEEFNDCLEKWKNKQFDNIIVPIFFNWRTRPGMTQEHYDSEKRVYTVTGPDKDSKMVQFRQTYPEIIEDMFLTNQKLLVSPDYINDQLNRIINANHAIKPVRGFFEPVFDYTKPSNENDDVPFQIVGANFIPTDEFDPQASVTIFMHPKKGWTHRYYQGTDPISTDNGYSNMASAVFDAHYNTLSAVVDYRDPNHKNTFLQCMLLGIYYDLSMHGTKKGIPELIEGNIGTAYADYKEYKGFGKSTVLKSELPDLFKGGHGTPFGIDNRGNRTRFIINKMYELTKEFGDKIWIDVFFKQLLTFVCTIKDSGTETWGTSDNRQYHDDVLFAGTFAYICRICFEFRAPRLFESESDKFVMTYPLVDNGRGGLTRRAVKKRISN